MTGRSRGLWFPGFSIWVFGSVEVGDLTNGALQLPLLARQVDELIASKRGEPGRESSQRMSAASGALYVGPRSCLSRCSRSS